jgi:asparagine synthase (glutamine-hydrolysing)
MCGINGILGLGTLVVKENIILRMNQAMIHRGPDAGDTYHDDHISLGHRRLSIIGLDETGNQPMKSSNKDVVLVFNGEIYNYKELKLLTPTYPYKSHTDTEVIIALYQSYGFEKMLELIDGMFAIALWDVSKKKLCMARDRFGKKPFYYSIVEDGTGRKQLVFSSEIRALIASELFLPKLNKDVLGEYLQIQCVREPNTIVKDVFQLPASNFCIVDIEQANLIPSSKLTSKSFWSLNINEEFTDIDYSQAVKVGRDLFYKSIEKRMISDVPLAAFLSGGIDSSCVVAGMTQLTSNKINTINISFTEQELSEKKYAEMVAEKFNTNHQNIIVNESFFLDEVIEAINNMDHPTGDGVNSYIVSKAAKNAGFTVALNGTGADEFFAGYQLFSVLNGMRKMEKLGLSHFINGLTDISKKIKVLQNSKLSRFLENRNMNTAMMYLKIRTLFNLTDHDFRMIDVMYNSTFDKNHWISQITEWELESYLKPVLLSDVDNMSMATSLEVRLPFMDHQLATFAYSLSDSVKITKQPKQLLIDFLDGSLPEEIWNRKKMGFTLPWKFWINTVLKDFVEAGLSMLESIDLFKSLIATERECFKHDVNIKWPRIWALAVLGHWIKNNNIKIE